MKPYLPTLALATLLISSPLVLAHHPNSHAPNSHTLSSHDPNSHPNGQGSSIQAEKKAAYRSIYKAGMTLNPRYIYSQHSTSARLPLLGVVSTPESGWLFSDSKAFVEGGWQFFEAWLDVLVAHAGASYSDAEKKLVLDHAFVALTKQNTSLKLGRIAPMAQPPSQHIGSLVLGSLTSDDHWHVDGVQLNQTINQAIGQTKLVVGGYGDGSYLGAISQGRASPFATLHAGLHWYSSDRTQGVNLNAMHAPNVLRLLSLKTEAQTHTHGSAKKACAQSQSHCFDGKASLVWLGGFWHSKKEGNHSHGEKGYSKSRYGVDALVAHEWLAGDINTPLTSLQTHSGQLHGLVDVFYQANSARFMLRAEAMQIKHDITGVLASQSVKNLGLVPNDTVPVRLSAVAEYALNSHLTLSGSATWDDTRHTPEMIYGAGLRFNTEVAF